MDLKNILVADMIYIFFLSIVWASPWHFAAW